MIKYYISDINVQYPKFENVTCNKIVENGTELYDVCFKVTFVNGDKAMHEGVGNDKPIDFILLKEVRGTGGFTFAGKLMDENVPVAFSFPDYDDNEQHATVCICINQYIIDI